MNEGRLVEIQETWYLKGLLSDVCPNFGNEGLTEMVSRIRRLEADGYNELQKKILGYLIEESNLEPEKHNVLVKVSSKITERLLVITEGDTQSSLNTTYTEDTDSWNNEGD